MPNWIKPGQEAVCNNVLISFPKINNPGALYNLIAPWRTSQNAHASLGPPSKITIFFMRGKPRDIYCTNIMSIIGITYFPLRFSIPYRYFVDGYGHATIRNRKDI